MSLCSPQIPHELVWDRTPLTPQFAHDARSQTPKTAASSIRIVYKILARKPEWKTPLQKSMSRWQDGIKWNLSEYTFLMYLMSSICQSGHLMSKIQTDE